MIGFLNYFQSYVPQLAELCVPFTNLPCTRAWGQSLAKTTVLLIADAYILPT
jgi:hypothetical protein